MGLIAALIAAGLPIPAQAASLYCWFVETLQPDDVHVVQF